MLATTSPYPTLADAIFGGGKTNALLRNALLVLAGSIFIALSAQLAIRLPISPVPITGQTFAVLIIGMAFGPRLGAATVIAYLLEGLYFPVFGEGRTWADPLTFWTAGYLIGFIAAAYITGMLAERGWDRSAKGTALAMLVGNLVIYIPGLSWLLALFLTQTDLTGFLLLKAVPYKGFAVFIPGDALKLALAVVAMPLAWKIIGRK